MTTIFNSMFAVWILYGVQLFIDMLFLQNHFLLSFAIAFVSYSIQISWHPLLDFYGFSLYFSYEISMEILCNFCETCFLNMRMAASALFGHGVPGPRETGRMLCLL